MCKDTGQNTQKHRAYNKTLCRKPQSRIHKNTETVIKYNVESHRFEYIGAQKL